MVVVCGLTCRRTRHMNRRLRQNRARRLLSENTLTSETPPKPKTSRKRLSCVPTSSGRRCGIPEPLRVGCIRSQPTPASTGCGSVDD
jgi:hypothetical protein